MAAQPKYLFVVMMDVAPEVEAAFNDVYDREHIPALLKVPGVRSAARYCTDTEGVPRYVAIYEMDRPDIPESAAFNQAADSGTWPHKIRPHTFNRKRVMYERIDDPGRARYGGGPAGGGATVSRPVVGVDIETVGQDWESLSPRVQTYLSETSKGDPDVDAAKEKLSLHAATGRIIAIGLWDLETARGRVLIEGDGSGWATFGEDAEVFRGTEAALVGEFWSAIAKDSPLIVTFNGRAFDAPYLMLRSAIIGVPPSRNLMGPRYRLHNHCDLYDVLTFWNASRMKGGLEFWCCQFGLPSSKDGMRGSEVGALYREGRLDEIARYCLDDARVTAQLYDRLRPVIAVLDAGTTL